MQSWVRSQSAHANDVTGNTYLRFTGNKPNAQYSLPASNGSVVSSEQFLNGTSAHIRLFSARKWSENVIKERK